MSVPTHIILYGSLRRGLKDFHAHGLDRALHLLQPVTFPGTLLDLGDYPGLLLEPSDALVHGELYEILKPSVLGSLDAFEVFRPHDTRPYNARLRTGSLYLRKIIKVERHHAQIYVFNGEILANGSRRTGPIIPSGDWLHHLAHR